MKYFLTFIFLCAGFLTKAEETALFRYADSLFVAGEYRIAAIEYERAAYRSRSNIEYTEALLRKSDCYGWISSYNEAVRILGRINFDGLPDELLANVYHKTALYAYLGGDFLNAESQLMQQDFYLQDKKMAQPSLYLYVLVLNELQKWPQAKLKMLEFIGVCNFDNQQEVEFIKNTEEIYSAGNQPRLKSIEKAQKLSSFLPGTGQIYAGYFLEGVTNAGLQALFLGLTAYGIYVKYYVTALAVGFTYFQRFYAGAMPRLEFLVKKKNHELTRQYNDPLRTFVLKVHEQHLQNKEK